jgi:small subunit ribosomal protein S3Ae
MAAKQSKASLIVKKKVWAPIIAPAIFNNQLIGEMYLDEPQNAVGRKVTVSLMALTGDPQRQNVHITFTISKAENNQLHTKLFGYTIVPVAVRKMMRRGRDRVDDSFVTRSQDGVALRVKPVLITRARATGSVLAHLRRQLRLTVVRAVNKLTFEDLMKELVAHKVQREFHTVLSKIYPLQVCELRDTHIETNEEALKRILTAAPAPEAPKAAEQPPAEQPVETQEATEQA